MVDDSAIAHVTLRIAPDGRFRPIIDERTVGLVPAGEVAVPSEERVQRVQSGGKSFQKFTAVAYEHYTTFRAVYEAYAGRPFGEIGAMLDWGCGCGRLTQMFLRALGPDRVYAADIDADNLGWCRNHLSGRHFDQCRTEPPLPYADATFDFIVAASVFTHIPEPLVVPWLKELARVLKPGGIAALTTAGDTNLSYRAWPAERLEELAARGIDDRARNDQLDGFIAEKEYYRNVRMTPDFVRRSWSEAMEFVTILDHAIGVQDIVVSRGRHR